MRKYTFAAIATVAMAIGASVAIAGNTWYVAPAPLGDDSYDGTTSNHVSGATGPRRTLASVMELAHSWDTVIALPGTYDEGSYEGSSSQYGRVHVPANVKLISLAGPEKTFIVGKAADAGDANGNGTGALRGVVLGGTIEGFTVCGGRVRSTSDEDAANGGGILAYAEGALAVNCIVSNNVANRGGGIHGNYRTMTGTNNRYTRAVNCQILSNSSARPASGSRYVDAWNCVYDGNTGAGGVAFANATARNCTILDGYTGATLFNSLLTGTDSGSCSYTNSVTVNLNANSTLGEGSTQTSAAGAAIGADYRPSKETNIGIDRGVYAYYEDNFPTGAAHFQDKDIRGFARVTGEAIDIGAGEYARLDLYVDANSGDDGNDGLASGTGHARRTMASVFAYAGLAHGDVVHAAPGTYNEGLMGVTGSTTNRVSVPAGVGLIADEGPDATFIDGAAATDSANSKNCGPDAVRCVSLAAEAWIKGFTLRGGATAMPDNYNDVGGGVRGDATSFAEGCVFRNCSARRGGGAFGGSYVNCIFESTCQAHMAQCSGGYNAAGYYGCVFNGSSAYGNIVRVVNCSFFGGSLGGNQTYPEVFNSYVATDGGKCNFHRCIVGSAVNSNSTGDDGTLFSAAAPTFDASTFRPLERSSLIDFGDSLHWKTNLPAAFPTCLAGDGALDVAGGQRIYNAAIDVGAGEYDWRGKFAAALSRNGDVSVAAAGEGVTLVADGLVLANGDSLSAVWALDEPAAASVATSVSGGGALSLSVDGAASAPDEEGRCTLRLGVGSHRLDFAYAGSGTARIGPFSTLRATCVIFR